MEQIQYVYVGVDIAQSSFEADFSGKVVRFSQDEAGFADFVSRLPSEACCVLEATGSYHCRLAYYLVSVGVACCVVNPLSAKSFASAQMLRSKTDKADAKMLSAYGRSLRPALWQPLPEVIIELQHLLSLLDSYIQQRTATQNRLHSLPYQPHHSATALQSLQRTLGYWQTEIADIEAACEKLVKAHYAETFENLTSIPGIGKKTATQLIASTQGFASFDHAKQVIAFIGLAPRTFQSGTSVKGKGHICKWGKGQLRKLLYMCAIRAKQLNTSCKDLYERLRAKGKPHKVAIHDCRSQQTHQTSLCYCEKRYKI
jgi:transposase